MPDAYPLSRDEIRRRRHSRRAAAARKAAPVVVEAPAHPVVDPYNPPMSGVVHATPTSIDDE